MHNVDLYLQFTLILGTVLVIGFTALIIHDKAWWFKSSRRQSQAKPNFEATQTVP